MGFYSFRKSMWTAEDANDAASCGEASCRDATARDLAEHRKTCRAKPGNCPFEKEKTSESAAQESGDMRSEQTVATVPNLVPPPMTLMQKCEKSLIDVRNCVARNEEWEKCLQEVDDILLADIKTDGEKYGLSQLRGSLRSEGSYIRSREHFLKNAMEAYARTANKYTERDLITEQSLAEADILKYEGKLDDYRNGVCRTVVQKVRAVLLGPACQPSEEYDKTLSATVRHTSDSLDSPKMRERFAAMQKAFDTLRKRRDAALTAATDGLKEASEALFHTTDADDFFARMANALGRMEEISVVNGDYEKGRRFVNNMLSDTCRRQAQMTDAERREYAGKWQSSMVENANKTVRLYHKDGDAFKARENAVSAVVEVARSAGHDLPDSVVGIMSTLNPKMVCMMASSIGNLEYVNEDTAFYSNGKIVMSNNDGYYNSAHTFFHEAGHAALAKFVKTYDRNSPERTDTLVNEGVLSVITDSASEEANGLFGSWYGGRNLFGLGTNFRKRDTRLSDNIRDTVRTTLYGEGWNGADTDAVDRATGAIGDIFCATTQGMVGSGHSSAYFQGNRNTPLHEIVADITAMHAMSPKITETLFPKTTRLVLGMVYGVSSDDDEHKRETFAVTNNRIETTEAN